MPILRLRAIEPKKICTISTELIDELQQLIKCPRESFTLEVVQSLFIKDGEFVDGNPLVEISWFDRGQEIQDKTALIVTKYVNSMGYKDVDVIFKALDKNKYYENGKHF
ncbi:hypothetical protein CPJCM30710_02750 [Clostridium polyendosporum]|uniref:DUF1904 domain-containing protein n=1 Tax=Clostridium polyendosporum TaxID=69208 RepID=A0A919RWI3_9CLOT|nr:DUF1904 domain-containing protein [Clostridium polyendosporum]GIM27609.1 hypothetical protein CPJCM30710_02750 [Clostridium polyendosporum]